MRGAEVNPNRLLVSWGILGVFPGRVALDGELSKPALLASDGTGEHPYPLTDVLRVYYRGEGVRLNAVAILGVKAHGDLQRVELVIPFEMIAPPMDADTVEGF